MAVTIGTDSGFVTVAPSGDPGGGTAQVDGDAVVTHDTSPVGAVKITEIGWWAGANAGTTQNFEVALYDATGTGGNAGAIVEVSRTNVIGAGTGWKRVTGLNWTITGSTNYWLGLQTDAPATTAVDTNNSGGSGIDRDTVETTLADPWGGGAIADVDGLYAIYAVLAAAPTAAFSGTPLNGEKPLTVQFTDSSTETPTSWLWNFGDGRTSTDENPEHIYTEGGKFTVSLIVTNETGSDTETKTEYVIVHQIQRGVQGTIGTKDIATKWPIEEGLTGGTQKQTGRVMNLVIQEASLVSEKEKVLL